MIEIIFIIAIVVVIIIVIVANKNGKKNNKDTFYGLPPGKHRAVGVADLGNNLGWATFSNNNIAQLNNDCSWCGPLNGLYNYCNLFGHQGTTPSSMLNYVEFAPMYNEEFSPMVNYELAPLFNSQFSPTIEVQLY